MRPLYLAASFAVLAATLITADMAEARRRPNNDGWYDRYENRRDARRAGIVAGVVTSAVVGSSARANAQNRYEECMESNRSQYYPGSGYAYENGYSYDCERRRYEDEMRANRSARRAGVVVGLTARAVVRD